MVSRGICVAVNSIPCFQMEVPEQTCFSEKKCFFIMFKTLLQVTFTSGHVCPQFKIAVWRNGVLPSCKFILNKSYFSLSTDLILKERGNDDDYDVCVCLFLGASLYSNTRLCLVAESAYEHCIKLTQTDARVQNKTSSGRKPSKMMHVQLRENPIFLIQGFSLKAIVWHLDIWNSMSIETKCLYISFRIALY